MTILMKKKKKKEMKINIISHINMNNINNYFYN